MKYTTFQTLTVRQYQQLYSINTSKDEPEDKLTQSLCVLTGLTERGVGEMLLPEFNQVSSELAKIFSKDINGRPKTFISVNGIRYGINYLPASLSSGQYVSIETWMAEGIIDNLHKIMATIVYEVKGWGVFKKRLKYNSDNHPQVAEALLECKFIDVHSACVFFLKLWKDSISSLVPYLEKELKAKGMKSKELRTILERGLDGYLTPKKRQTLRT